MSLSKTILIILNKKIGLFFIKSRLFYFYFNLRSRILRNHCIIKKNSNLIEIVGKKFFYIHLIRSDYYINGLERRFEKLKYEYFLDNFPKYKCKSFIDIGANIGEIPLSIASYMNKIKYVGIEASPLEYNCLKKNIPMHIKDYELLNNISGDKNDIYKNFYISSEQADSSPIKPIQGTKNIRIKQVTIDSVIEKYRLNEVFIKIDTEGYEPETIMGIKTNINKIRYISVDCGFERGIDNLSTLPKVTTLLYQKGFEMIGNNKKRMTYLFKNKNRNN
jgi:FkbM family methyltransferase